MGFISSVGSFISKAVNTFAPIVKSVAGAVGNGVLDTLKTVVGSGFDGIKNIASTVASSFPSLSGLLNKFAIPGLSMVQNAGLGGLDSVQQFLNQILGQPQQTQVDGGNVNGGTDIVRPPATQAAQSYAASSSPTGTQTSAAIAAVGGLPPAIAGLVDKALSPGLSPQQSAMIAKAKAAGADEKQLAMMEVQMTMDNMKQMMEMFSNLAKTMAGISNTITGNMRG